LLLALAAAVVAHLWLLPAMVHPPTQLWSRPVSRAYPIWNGLERRLVLGGAVAALLASLVPLLWLRRHRLSQPAGAGLAVLGALAVLGVTLWSPPRLAPHLGLPRWSFDAALHGLLFVLSFGALLWAVSGWLRAEGQWRWSQHWLRRRGRVAAWLTGGTALAVVVLLLVPRPARGEAPQALLRNCFLTPSLNEGGRQCTGSEENPRRERVVPLARIPRAVALRRQTRRMLVEQLECFSSGACCFGGKRRGSVSSFRLLWHRIVNQRGGLYDAWFFLVWQEIRWLCLALAVGLVPLWALLASRRRAPVVLAAAIGVLAGLAAMSLTPELPTEPLWKHVPTALWAPLGVALLVALAAPGRRPRPTRASPLATAQKPSGLARS